MALKTTLKSISRSSDSFPATVGIFCNSVFMDSCIPFACAWSFQRGWVREITCWIKSFNETGVKRSLSSR